MTSIFVAKLDFAITSEQLKQAFQEYGTVLKATVATDRETGKSRGFAFIEMADKIEAQAAIKGLDGSLMNNRPIAVKEAEQRQDNRSTGKPDFNRSRETNSYQRTDTAPRDNYSENRRPDNDGEKFTPPPIELLKTEPRKKEKEKKKEWDTEGKAKKPKMDAYKKSGKGNRFFDDDDDLDDLENTSFFNFDDDEEDKED